MGRYLITGGAGFVGSHIAEACLAAGHEVRVLDDLSLGLAENLAGLPVELVEGSILDPARLARCLAGVDGVFHEAAIPSVPRSVEDPVTSFEVNATGTLQVLQAARQAGVRVVYAGSSSAYGDSETLPKREDMPARPLSPCAAAKLAGEQLCQVFARVYGLPTVVLRYFNVFGPRQRADSPYSGVIARFCMAALDGSEVRVDGDGEQSRDFTYVSDVARGNLLAMTSDLPGGTVLNLSGGGRYSLLRLLEVLEGLVGRPIPRRHAAPRPGDVRHSQADVSRARELLGFATEVGFEEGVRSTLDWYREQRDGAATND
ncbi:MAG: SDR family oxidoreductase [Planctomycetota bacterium]